MPPSLQQGILFSKLPPELRSLVYDAALNMDGNDAFTMFQTCQQINNDAQRNLYQRSATFTSQAHFFAWIECSPPDNLALIKTLSLSLTDIDLSPLMDPRALSDPKRRTTIWTLCESELRKLQHSFRALPILSHMTIVPPTNGQPAFWEAVYRPFLASLVQLCPQLTHLELHDSEELSKMVQALTLLAKVTFLRQMPKPSLEDVEERRKSFRSVATVDFNVLLGVVNEGRRAVSAPVLGRWSMAAPRTR